MHLCQRKKDTENIVVPRLYRMWRKIKLNKIKRLDDTKVPTMLIFLDVAIMDFLFRFSKFTT